MDTENTRAPLDPTAGKLSAERVARVEQLVKERLAQPIHVEDMAAAAGLSPFHFSRMFHAATGKAPHAFVTSKRMEAACDLLANTDLPLAKVAIEVGYRTQAHFTGVFHRHVGVTPRTYRISSSEGSGAAPGSSTGEGDGGDAYAPGASRPQPTA